MAQYPNALNGIVPPGPTGAFGNVVGTYARPIAPGESLILFGANATPETPATFEAVNAGEASVAVCIVGSRAQSVPPEICVQLQFSAAPGAFEVDVQEADTDADFFYITPSNLTFQITAVDAAKFIARADLSPLGGKFIRLYIKALANNVKLIAKITRLA